MASKYIQKFPIPNGFPEILNDFSKEILRYQPENIIEFSALYFKCLQEGKELDYQKKGQNIPCDFKNVVPGTRSSEREKIKDLSNFEVAKDKGKLLNLQTSEKEETAKPKPTMTAATKKVAERLKNKADNKEDAPPKNPVSDINIQAEKREYSGNSQKLRISNDYVNELLSKSYKDEEEQS